jgi:DNA-binding transcriptional regulator GbsR (MarR family)
LEEHYEIPVEEAQPEEQQQPATAEGHETEVMEQQQEKVESRKKPFTTPKAIRLATISNLLEKQTNQLNKIGQMVQPLQKQLKSVETRTEFIKQIHSQLKQLQKEMSQVQKESQKIRLLLTKKSFSRSVSTKKRVLKRNSRRPRSKDRYGGFQQH